MKKTLALLTGFMCIFSFTACGNETTESSSVSVSENSVAESDSQETESTTSESKPETLENSDNISNKTLVVYYSASGNTAKVAEYIADETRGDLFEIQPVNIYSDDDLNWTNPKSRVCVEHDNPDQRNVELVSTSVDGWDSYDTVFIGYPIWWQEAAWVVDDFVKENDFTGKNVIPFCTSMSSPLGQSGNKLSEMAGTGNWFKGMRFTSRSSETDVKEWLSNLNLYKENKNNILQFDDVDTFTSNITINRIKKIA